MIYTAHTYQELLDIASKHNGFIKINWCGDGNCEDKIKEDTKMKSRCLIEDEEVDDVCCVCGKAAKHKVYFGRQY